MAGDRRPNTVVLLSMGYDSLSAWHQLGRPPAVHFDVGSRYSRPEMARYERLRASFPQLLPVQDLRWLGPKEQDDAWVPLRNLVMSVHAAALGFDDIVMSSPADWSTDKRLMFTLATSVAMRVAEPGVGYRVRRPFSHWTKARLIAATPADLLEGYAYSCYEGADLPCGRCTACGRAVIAHLAAGREPPTGVRAGMSFGELMNLRRGARSGGSSFAETAPRHAGELLYLPLRGWELLRAWNNYRRR